MCSTLQLVCLMSYIEIVAEKAQTQITKENKVENTYHV